MNMPNSIQENKKRNSGIDFLKIMLAILIIMNHSIGHGIKTIDYNLYTSNQIFLNLIWAFANPAVNIFFLISGYFQIKRNKKSAIYFLETMIIIGTVSSIVSFFLGNMTVFSIVKAIILPWSSWWFMTVYMILWILSPFINGLIDNISDTELKELCYILLLVTFLQGFVFNGAFWGTGFSFSQAITMYICGRYLSRKAISNIYRSSFFVILFALLTIIEFILYQISIAFFPAISDRLASYSCPIVILQSISLFLAFLKLDCSKIEKVMGYKMSRILKSCVLIVYLISDFSGIKKYIFIPLVKLIKLSNLIFIPIFVYAIMLFILTIPLCVLLKFVSEKTYNKFIKFNETQSDK